MVTCFPNMNYYSYIFILEMKINVDLSQGFQVVAFRMFSSVSTMNSLGCFFCLPRVKHSMRIRSLCHDCLIFLIFFFCPNRLHLLKMVRAMHSVIHIGSCGTKTIDTDNEEFFTSETQNCYLSLTSRPKHQTALAESNSRYPKPRSRCLCWNTTFTSWSF